MQAGRLNRRVTIEQMGTAQDEIGEPVATWVSVCSVWADIRMVSGMETIKASTDTSIVKASIRIRYRDGINAGMRVVHGLKIYEIKAGLPDVSDKEYLDLVCEAVE